MADIELKPCPFCGNPDIFLGIHTRIVDGNNVQYAIGCSNCYISTIPYWSKEEAIKAWNRRVNNG